MKTKTQTFVIALAMMLALAIVPSMAFGQLITVDNEGRDNDLVGVWEAGKPDAFFRGCRPSDAANFG